MALWYEIKMFHTEQSKMNWERLEQRREKSILQQQWWIEKKYE